MKRILFVCCLLTATCAVPFQKVQAQTSVTSTTFIAKVNLLDSYIAANNMTMAQTTWDDVHNLMLNQLAVSKASIAGAANPTIAASYRTTNQNQYAIYDDVWALKTNLTANRTALNTKLLAFAATF